MLLWRGASEGSRGEFDELAQLVLDGFGSSRPSLEDDLGFFGRSTFLIPEVLGVRRVGRKEVLCYLGVVDDFWFGDGTRGGARRSGGVRRRGIRRGIQNLSNVFVILDPKKHLFDEIGSPSDWFKRGKSRKVE